MEQDMGMDMDKVDDSIDYYYSISYQQFLLRQKEQQTHHQESGHHENFFFDTYFLKNGLYYNYKVFDT